MIKKIALSVLAFVLLFVHTMLPFSASQIYAQGSPWYAPDFRDFYVKVYDENVSSPSQIFGERYTAAQVTWVIWGLASFFINLASKHAGICIFTMEWTSCQDALSSLSYEIESQEALLATPTSIDSFTSRPISGIAYFKDIGQKLHIIPEAQAQETGFGFQAGSSVLQLWRVSRDISYALMVIVIIIMAFMIMFRLKISPQVIITVQSALPKVIISLVLITFSYAIAGFLIDLMYVVFGIIAAIVDSTLTGSRLGWLDVFRHLTEYSALRFFGAYLFTLALALIPIYLAITLFTLPTMLLGAPFMIIQLLVVAIFILLIIVVLFLALKTIWLLLKTYVMIILKIIIGPFYILFGTITPGGGIGPWMRSIVADLAVYPTVAVMFVLSLLFLRSAVYIDTGNMIFPSEWAPVFDEINNIVQNLFFLDITPQEAFASTWTPPFTMFTAGFSGPINLAISFVLISMVPKSAELVKSAIGKGQFSVGSAIGTAIGPGIGAARFGSRAGFDRYQSGLSDRINIEEAAIQRMDPAAQRTAIGTKATEIARLKKKLERAQRLRGRYGV